MTIVEDVDLEAFREAGEKAYEALNLVEHKNKVQARDRQVSSSIPRRQAGGIDRARALLASS